MAMIPLSVPNLAGNEWAYVKQCLDAGWVSSAGEFVDRFEDAFARYTGAQHAVAVVNGTAALQVALRTVGVAQGDEVIVPALTFIATINAVSYLNAHPVFMDCDAHYNLDPACVLEFLDRETEVRNGATYNRRTQRRIAALMPVHVFGNAVDLEPLVRRCRDQGIAIVEDAAESLGTRYRDHMLQGRHTGTIGDVGCFSFNGNKIITTGGGGMIVTDNAEHARRARHLTTQAKADPVRYIHDEVGYNFRLTNLQAAVGVAQLEQLPGFLQAKRRNFLALQQGVADIDGLTIPDSPPYAANNHWMYPLQIDANIYGMDREGLMAHLHARGIQTRPVWYLNHLQKPYLDCQHYRINRAKELFETTLNIPCSTNLSGGDIDQIIAGLRRG